VLIAGKSKLQLLILINQLINISGGILMKKRNQLFSSKIKKCTVLLMIVFFSSFTIPSISKAEEADNQSVSNMEESGLATNVEEQPSGKVEAVSAGAGATGGLGTAKILGIGTIAAGAIALGLAAFGGDDEPPSVPAHGN